MDDENRPYVIEQLAEVRESGLANMMDRRAVGQVADILGCDDLAAFCDGLDRIPMNERSATWMAALNDMALTLTP